MNTNDTLLDTDKKIGDLQIALHKFDDVNDKQKEELMAIKKQLSDISKKTGIVLMSGESKKSETKNINDINDFINEKINFEFNKRDNRFDLTKRDLFASLLIAGIAVVIDFLLVKIPKDPKRFASLKNTKIVHNGSPLTGFLRTLGVDDNGDKSEWVKWLEEKCKVPYDKSVDPNLDGLNPVYHRLRSLGHDPLIGVFFALIDINCGTLTIINKAGRLVIKKVAEGNSSIEILKPIIIWFGHLLSDVTTSMGIPIPGWSLLQLLQFGSFGEKERTVSQIAEYMYYNGYDIRHLMTMSVEVLAIELLTRIYFAFLGQIEPANNSRAEIEYTKVKNKIKLHRMLEIVYAVSATGNAAKLVMYDLNPCAINLVVWIGALKEALGAYKIATRESKDFEKVMEQRYTIDSNWEFLNKQTDAMLKYAKDM